jgi:hypothetical protein
MEIGAESRVLANERRERRLRLPGAAIDHVFLQPPCSPKSGRGTRRIREIPACADVAQLVEHFTRNEGVPGSIPGVGSEESPATTRVLIGSVSIGMVLSSGRGTVGEHQGSGVPDHRVEVCPPFRAKRLDDVGIGANVHLA